MSRGARSSHRWQGEQGAIAVTSAGLLLLATVILAFVIVIAQWMEHKRHLQTQADAAALAAATEYAYPCTPNPDAVTPDATTTGGRIMAQANDYGLTKNPQVDQPDQSKVHLVLNKKRYFGQAGQDDTVEGDPCVSGMIDVKMTETSVTSLLGLVGINPTINAHARVQAFTVDTTTGNLPIGVTDSNPKTARAIFIDEDTGEEIVSTLLVRDGDDAEGNPRWDNAASPVALNVGTTHKNIGVRIALSGQASAGCAQPLVACYDAGSTNGLGFIRGWSGEPTGTGPAPVARSVTLAPAASTGCPDPYFSRTSTTCSVTVSAQVDFGTAGDPTKASSAGGVGALLQAKIGTSNTAYPLTYSATTGTWTSESIPVGPEAGPLPVTLEWAETDRPGGNCKNSGFSGSNTCKGTFGQVQRTFAGSASRSGPIRSLSITDITTGQGAHSLRQCDSSYTTCAYGLTVAVSLSSSGTLKPATSPDDQPYLLINPDNNQNQALNCDPAISTYKDELAAGCNPIYRINTGQECPANASALWSTPQPWNCMALSTGQITNQIPAGLNQRILGSDKPALCSNPSKPGFGPNLFRKNFGTRYTGDPRLVHLVITPYGSFSGTGQATVPVTNVASFYITGWAGSDGGFKNPCETADIPTDPNLRDETRPGDGWVVGHFVKFDADSTNETPSDQTCDLNSVTTCVTALTR